jgi:hypothetical protein
MMPDIEDPFSAFPVLDAAAGWVLAKKNGATGEQS